MLTTEIAHAPLHESKSALLHRQERLNGLALLPEGRPMCQASVHVGQQIVDDVLEPRDRERVLQQPPLLSCPTWRRTCIRWQHVGTSAATASGGGMSAAGAATASGGGGGMSATCAATASGDAAAAAGDGMSARGAGPSSLSLLSNSLRSLCSLSLG